MRAFTSVLAAALALTPLASIAASPRASATAEQQLWKLAEKLALALPGDGRDVSKIVSASTDLVAPSGRIEHRAATTEIDPSLSATNAVVVIGESGRADSVSFNLTGSCVPVASLRDRYPSLIVMDYARGDSEHETYTFGTLFGDSIIAYSFPANKLGCMNRVEVTPAAATKTKLEIK
jgi:hypothetical protein